MKVITLTLEIEINDAGKVVVAALNKSAEHRPASQTQAIKGQTAEQVCQTKSAQLVHNYFLKLKPGRHVPRGRVSKFLAKKGYNPSTAMPALSALFRAGHISRVERGVYAAKKTA